MKVSLSGLHLMIEKPFHLMARFIVILPTLVALGVLK